MKELFGIAAAVAMGLMVCVFTGCAHEYTGRYWITEYVENVSLVPFTMECTISFIRKENLIRFFT